ncbi:MAG: hemerythrin family protein [Rhodospirillales bacterium]|nr:hemerythrin family protein [Rhodospirillales bacterium]
MKDFSLGEAGLTGYRTLDGEHHVQIDLLSAFSRVASGAQEGGDLDEIFDRLVEYTKVHFASEQMLMRLYQYPRFDEHVVDHERTIERLEDLRQALARADETQARAVAADLKEWIIAHICSADLMLGQYLVRLGVGPG